MNRTHLIRWLRISASAACLIICALLIGLWVRSYNTADVLMVKFTTTRAVSTVSLKGGVGITDSMSGRLIPNAKWGIKSIPAADQEFTYDDGTPIKPTLGFSFVQQRRGLGILIPYWFLVLLSTVIAVTPWISWSLRFSLRTMLIVTTLIAVVLGLVVWLVGR